MYISFIYTSIYILYNEFIIVFFAHWCILLRRCNEFWIAKCPSFCFTGCLMLLVVRFRGKGNGCACIHCYIYIYIYIHITGRIHLYTHLACILLPNLQICKACAFSRTNRYGVVRHDQLSGALATNWLIPKCGP